MTLKICHLSDVHLGFRRYYRINEQGINQREHDVNLAFKEAINKIIQIRPDLVIIAGDLFHSVRPSNYTLAYAFRVLKKMQHQLSGSKLVILAGNHDSHKRIESGSVLKIFSEIEGVYVSDTKIDQFEFPEFNCAVSCLPHRAIHRYLHDIKTGYPQLRANDRFKHNILVTHAQVSQELVSDFGGVDLTLSDLNSHEWDYIALGHVHLASQVATNAFYSGSIEHTANNIWPIANSEKGFLEISLPSLKHKLHPLNSVREANDLQEINVESLNAEEVISLIEDKIANVVDGIDGKLLKLEIRNIERDVFRAIDHRKIKHWKAQAANFSFNFIFKDRQQISSAFQQTPDGKSTDRQQHLEKQLLGYISQAYNQHDLLDDYLNLAREYYAKIDQSQSSS